ncbi:unnamed protein product, partial [Umbelopsis vinacea]
LQHIVNDFESTNVPSFYPFDDAISIANFRWNNVKSFFLRYKFYIDVVVRALATIYVASMSLSSNWQ